MAKLIRIFSNPDVTLPVLGQMRQARPLVHNITNFVVMNWTANVLLAAGASPAMVHAPEEAGDFAAIAGALVINIGTLDAGFVKGMNKAVASARAHNIPWVLDPVGVGATAYRQRVCGKLAGLGPAVIRGNAGEIIALAGLGTASGKGVDSLVGSNQALEAARALSARTGAVVAVTGETDLVVQGDEVFEIEGGDAMSQAVTGTGCAATAIIGACLAVAPPLEAAIAGLSLMKAAATRAAKRSEGPGSFAPAFLDALHALMARLEPES